MRKVIPVLLVGVFALALLVPASVNAVTAKGHWRIHQDQFDPGPATDLHFTIWQKESWVTINSWDITTALDGNCTGSVNFTMNNFALQPGSHEVACEFWAGSILYCCWVEINAKLDLTSWNTARLKDVKWTQDPIDTIPDDMPDNGWDACKTEEAVKMRFMYYNDDLTRGFELRGLKFYRDGTGELSNTNMWNWSTWNYTAPYSSYVIEPGGYIIVNIPDFMTGHWLYFVAEIWAGGIKVADVRGQHQDDGYTDVSLASFEAIGFDDRVEINWATANEINNAGFNIYRSASRDGAQTRVNDVLIPARGDEIAGAEYSFVDRGASGGLDYYYWFEDVSLDGNKGLHGPVLASRKPATPAVFSLAQNYPNPFNPNTEIGYDLTRDCHVTLEVYNVAGQRVATLVDQFQTAGQKLARWDGKDTAGMNVSSGVYFYSIKAADFSAIRKMILLR